MHCLLPLTVDRSLLEETARMLYFCDNMCSIQCVIYQNAIIMLLPVIMMIILIIMMYDSFVCFNGHRTDSVHSHESGSARQ